MNRDKIEEIVRECIVRVAKEQAMQLPTLEGNKKIVDDLGFKSLDVATLTAFLEASFNVDPFADDAAIITEIRTVNDVCDVYENCLNGVKEKPKASLMSDRDKARLERRTKKNAA